MVCSYLYLSPLLAPLHRSRLHLGNAENFPASTYEAESLRLFKVQLLAELRLTSHFLDGWTDWTLAVKCLFFFLTRSSHSLVSHLAELHESVCCRGLPSALLPLCGAPLRLPANESTKREKRKSANTDSCNGHQHEVEHSVREQF